MYVYIDITYLHSLKIDFNGNDIEGLSLASPVPVTQTPVPGSSVPTGK